MHYTLHTIIQYTIYRSCQRQTLGCMLTQTPPTSPKSQFLHLVSILMIWRWPRSCQGLYTPYSIHYTVYLDTIHYTVYSIHWMLWTVCYTLYTYMNTKNLGCNIQYTKYHLLEQETPAIQSNSWWIGMKHKGRIVKCRKGIFVWQSNSFPIF